MLLCPKLLQIIPPIIPPTTEITGESKRLIIDKLPSFVILVSNRIIPIIIEPTAEDRIGLLLYSIPDDIPPINEPMVRQMIANHDVALIGFLNFNDNEEHIREIIKMQAIPVKNPHKTETIKFSFPIDFFLNFFLLSAIKNLTSHCF